MSKILLIQPHKMLQQAIALALFPNHDVHVSETVPASLEKSFEAVIVDVTALRETSKLSSDSLKIIAGWTTPTIWIGDRESPQTPTRDTLVVMQTPIAKETLYASLAECLGTSIPAKQNGISSVGDKARNEATDIDSGVSSATRQDTEVIDLVEVVDDEPARNPTKGFKKE